MSETKMTGINNAGVSKTNGARDEYSRTSVNLRVSQQNPEHEASGSQNLLLARSNDDDPPSYYPPLVRFSL